MAICTLVAACQSTASEPVATTEEDAALAQEAAARYGYDVATASDSPVFALVPEYKDPRDTYARALLARECMRGVMDVPVVPPSANSGQQAIDPRTGQRTFTEALVSVWGYEIPTEPLPTSSVATVPVTPAIQQQMEECGQSNNDRLGLPPQRPLNAIEDAGWAARESDPAVQAAAEAWRECMDPAGVIDLPADPFDMPTGSVQGTGGVPTDRQREVAVMDVGCREQADYDGAVLRARAQAELVAIGRDLEGFDAAREQYRVYGEGIDQVIEQFG